MSGKHYYVNGIQLNDSEGYNLVRLAESLDKLGVPHLKVEEREFNCTCVRIQLDQETSNYYRDPHCMYHNSMVR